MRSLNSMNDDSTLTNMSVESLISQDEKQPSTVPERARSGTFLPGSTGNKGGRPKGSKNALTLLRREIEQELREAAAPVLVDVMYKCLEMALNGDRHMIKLLLELHIGKQVAQDDESAGKNQVNVLIQRADDRPIIVNAKVITDGKVQRSGPEPRGETAGHTDEQPSEPEGELSGLDDQDQSELR